MIFASPASDCGAKYGVERGDDFSVLVREHGSQVDLEQASLNIPNNGRRVRTQACSQFLWPKRVMSNIERRGLNNRARQRAAADLSATHSYRCLQRQPAETRNDFP